jgi:methylenetetrahydrofolate reductase (NADPH)
MRDYGVYLSGRKLTVPPPLFLGAAENPFAPPFAWRPQRLAKKVAAGAEFIQTQYCFDLPRMRQFMQGVCDLGLHKKAFILAGVGPLRSAGAAEFMRTKVPGVYIPDAVVERLKGVPKNKQRAEGKRICVEMIQQVREMPGVAGVHVMAYRQEELVAEIMEEAGLLPRPSAPTCRTRIASATSRASTRPRVSRNNLTAIRTHAKTHSTRQSAAPCKMNTINQMIWRQE